MVLFVPSKYDIFLQFFYVLDAFVFFFFKQNKADEMRISDWSSDVCSSDLEWKSGRAENARAAGAGRQRMGSRSLIGRSAPSFPIPYSPFPLLPRHISCLATSSPRALYCFQRSRSGPRAPS